MSESTLISIIIPTHNRAWILHKTLNSIINQSYANWQCIIIDDGSTDNTKSIVQSYIERDTRFSYSVNTRTKGAPGARNTGILLSKGEFIYLFDSDNWLESNALETFASAINSGKDDVYTCYAKVLNKEGAAISEFNWNNQNSIQDELLSGKTYVDNNISVIRKEALLKIGLTDENCPSYQEWDTHIRISEFCTYKTISEFLVNYSSGESDAISQDLYKSANGFLYVLQKHSEKFTDESALIAQGVQGMKLALLTEDKEFIKNMLSTYNEFIPGFNNHYHSHKLKSKLENLKSSFKNSVKRLIGR